MIDLLPFLADSREEDVSLLARRALGGEPEALGFLHDELEYLGMTHYHPSVFATGTDWFVQTVTFSYLGRVVSHTLTEIILGGDGRDGRAAVVYDTGNFSDFLGSGRPQSLVVFPGNIVVGRASLICATPWPHPLPSADVAE